MIEINFELVKERFELAIGRIGEIASTGAGEEVAAEFCDYFEKTAEFLATIDEVYRLAENGTLFSMPLADKEKLNDILYKELTEKQYEVSYCNPAYAVRVLGKEYGAFLAALRAELRSLIAYAYEKNLFAMTIRMELFLELLQ